jgi:hypothetical protein
MTDQTNTADADTLDDWQQAASVEADARRHALAENRILRAEVEALHAAVRRAYEAGFEEAACGGGSILDDERASASVDGILNEAIDAAMRAIAGAKP